MQIIILLFNCIQMISSGKFPSQKPHLWPFIFHDIFLMTVFPVNGKWDFKKIVFTFVIREMATMSL